MYYLLSRAPGKININGRDIQVLSGETIPVEKEHVPQALNSYSYLTLIYKDAEDAEDAEDATTTVVNPNTQDEGLVLLENATQADILHYIHRLAEIEPIDYDRIRELAQEHASVKRIVAACTKVLSSEQT